MLTVILLGNFDMYKPKAGPPSHILLQKDGQMVDGKVKTSDCFSLKFQSLFLLIGISWLQMRSLLEQAEEMVESEELLEEEFNQVIYVLSFNKFKEEFNQVQIHALLFKKV